MIGIGRIADINESYLLYNPIFDAQSGNLLFLVSCVILRDKYQKETRLDFLMGKNAQISEEQLASLIPRFYARVRDDTLIGPVFEAAIGDWTHHLERLVSFWSSVMLTSGRYKGNPVAAHLMHLSLITPPMFDRWLALWTQVTAETLPPEIAVGLQDKAARIAESLKLALYFRLAPAPATSLGLVPQVSRKDRS